MKIKLMTVVALVGVATLGGQIAEAGLIVTGIVDGNRSGGVPKAIEVYVDGTIDFSTLTVQRSTNGAAFANITITGLTGTFTNEFVYFTTASASFVEEFGSSGDFANLFVDTDINGNGNDGFRFLSGATVLDTVHGVNNTLAYSDSYMYRIDGTGPDGDFVASNWQIPGNDSLDAYTTAGSVGPNVPFGTYALPEPASLALLGVGGLLIAARRRSA